MKFTKKEKLLIQRLRRAMKYENSGDNGINDILLAGDIADCLNILLKLLDEIKTGA